ncbi:MAG TPA: tetratricopeptide repeat protein [Sulfuricella sp.]|nr:tetratricopeptide repeat protein [Sulfuricella sp.]
MESIKAFVAHSFSDEDSGVVAVILKCLDRVAELHPKFSWAHAEHPEPSLVDAKVLSLISDKNLFIGICTKKERVVLPSALSPGWFGLASSSLTAKESDFEWKTSDWIIQEIGLAIGRDMKIILLVEENTKSPGALQGNLEYIEFSRNTPEKCFDKLLGMIASLSPRAANTSVSEQEANPQSGQDINPIQLPAENHWTTHKPDWITADYQLALWWYIRQKDESGEKRITELYYASPEGGDDEKRKEWIAHQEALHVIHGRGDLAKLERYSADLPMNSAIATDLASGYLHYQEHDKAAKAYLLAADTCKDERKKIKLLGDAALNYLKAGDQSQARELEARMIQLSEKSGQGEMDVLQAKKDIAEQEKDDETALAVLERLIEINPGDIDARFSLAYKYSEMGRDNLAAFHYSRIPPAERKSYAWNNLGVTLERLGMPIKSVAAYKRSEELGETLAMSNLAIKLRSAGFAQEAHNTLDAALKIADHHKNVEVTLASIKDEQDAEDKKETATYEKAKPISEFYRHYGRSLVRAVANIAGKWQSPNCPLVFTVDGATVNATGSYEVPRLGVFANPFAKNNSTPLQFIVEYKGIIQGMAIVGTVQRRPAEDAPQQIASVLASSEPHPSVLMWVSEDCLKIHVLERNVNSEPKIHEFTRV